MLGRKLACAAFVVGGLALTSSAFGQGYTFTAGSASGMVGSNVTAAVNLDNTTANNVQGWSFGVCHDAVAVTLVSAVSGSTAMTVNGGSMPSFEAINTAPAGGAGYTCGVVIDFFGVNSLAPGSGFELTVGMYTLNTEGSSPLNLCGTLGNPMVETLVVVNGGSVVPTQVAGTLEGQAAPPVVITFDAGDATARFNAGGSVSPGVVVVTMTSVQAGDPTQAEVQGFSFGLLDGSAVDLAEINLSGTVTAGTNGGTGPDFFAAQTAAVGGDGGTVGVVVSLSPPFDVIAPGTDLPIANFVYEASATAVDGDSANLTFSDSLGNPAVALVAVVDGNTVVPSTVGGVVSVEEVVDVAYLRGDANSDGGIDIADGIWILNFLWQGGPASPCAASQDANGDGMGDTSDAMYIIFYQLLDGPAPVGNFPNCDFADVADCAMSTPSCP
ncbi:MAG: hypothetical protein AB7O52_00595 [Planctomycetota bacterium]